MKPKKGFKECRKSWLQRIESKLDRLLESCEDEEDDEYDDEEDEEED